MKDQQIDLHEVEKDLLGTENERKVPPQKSWPCSNVFCTFMCAKQILAPMHTSISTPEGLLEGSKNDQSAELD